MKDAKLYLLRDKDNEKRYRTTLEQTVSRALKNKRQLFKNYQIYISSHVVGYSALLKIVEANGGEARIISHSISQRAKILRADYLRTVDQFLIVTPHEEDRSLRKRFRDEVVEGGLVSGMFTSEWIMVSVLRQEIVSDDIEDMKILA